jgi:hypothetical protein
MSNPYREPSIDASYQVSVHLAKRFQRRRFLEIDQLETRIACSSHIDWMISKKSSPLKPLCQMNRNLVACIYGRSSIKIAHFVPIHVSDRDKMSNPYREPSIDASYQVSVHLAKRFQLTNMPTIDNSCF